MSAVEYEVGCAVCRKPVVLRDGGLHCPMHGICPPNLLRQTGRKRRRQFIGWEKTRRPAFPFKPVDFR